MKEINFKNRKSIKKELVKLGVKEECSLCGLGKVWNGKPMTLQLDHIDGNNSNNSVDNLRLICPNCHSQTKNYAGRNKKNKENKERPSKKILIDLYMNYSIRDISLIRGVSVRTVYNWVEHYNLASITKPRPGGLSCAQVRFIRRETEKGETQRTLAKKIGVSKGCIQDVVENKTYCYC